MQCSSASSRSIDVIDIASVEINGGVLDVEASDRQKSAREC